MMRKKRLHKSSNRSRATRLAALTMLLLAWLPLVLAAQLLTGTVVAVADGDTFTLLTADQQQVKVRLHGIDCPEKKQPYSAAAKAFTSQAIFGKTVHVQGAKKDRFGRVLGTVYYGTGQCLNEQLLAAGWAWHYKKYDRQAAWAVLEQQARTAKKGLWQDAHPIAPWQWRGR
jgi:endonuclease YncB( thermonuclease family)